MRLRMLATGILALAAAAAAGCGGGNSYGTTGGATTATTATTTTTTSSSGKTVTITEKDFSLEPSTVTVAAGSVTFEAKNAGGTDHALAIEGNGLAEQQTDSVGPHDSSFMTVDLKPGRYTMFCPVDGHRALGMKGTITVSG